MPSPSAAQGSQSSFKRMISLMASNPEVRQSLLAYLEEAGAAALCGDDLGDNPRRVREEELAHAMALANRLCKILDKGLMGPGMLERWVDLFMDEIVHKLGQRRAMEELGFKPPHFLVISPTGKCNLACKGCYAASESGLKSLDEKTFDALLTQKKELWGSHFTVLSGGEPFLWKDGDVGLLDMTGRHGDQLFLSFTNGTLINDETAARMAEVCNFTPCISVEGFEKETDARRGKGVFKKIMKAFDILRKHRVGFGVSVTPTRENWEVLSSDEFLEFYFEQQGAFYGWMFQYMPIGREQSLDLMLTPEERLELYYRTQRMVHEKKCFVADFWNSGVASSGCLAGGRESGYLYIDWNGNVTPCVFVPYAVANIKEVFAGGGTINDVWKHPFFAEIRKWQKDYGYKKPAEEKKNWLAPCPMRDHFRFMESAIRTHGAWPITKEARQALEDPDYIKGLAEYGDRYRALSEPIWQRDYMSTIPGREREKAASAG
ncbi:MAG: radical SAM protein [Deltaproteobacteria bacterium]|nr:radical SAM protein [Deltaproteobacteria bacterium]